MAREAHDREDLLADATAFAERIEFAIATFPEPVVVGFRRDGSLSMFFGSDPVYQFNCQAELRRAFVADLIYKADSGILATLERVRSENEVVLVRRDLAAAQQTAFLGVVESRLMTLSAALASWDYKIVGQVPAECDILSRVAKWLSAMELPLRVAQSPRVS